MFEFEFEVTRDVYRDLEKNFKGLREKMKSHLKDVQIGDKIFLPDGEAAFLEFKVVDKIYKIGYYPIDKNIISFELMPLF